MTIDRVPVDLGSRSYTVDIGQGLIDAAGDQIAPLLHRKRVAIVTDAHVAPLRRHKGLAAFGADR
jgi:3-dehydroquinate synthase